MEGILEKLGPIVAIVMMMGIPMLIILVKHQQKMAKIVREDAKAQQHNPQVETLQREIEVLRSTVNQQTIILDNIASQQRVIADALKSSSDIEQRLRSS